MTQLGVGRKNVLDQTERVAGIKSACEGLPELMRFAGAWCVIRGRQAQSVAACLLGRGDMSGKPSMKMLQAADAASVQAPAEYTLTNLEKKFLLYAERGDCASVKR